MLCLFDKAFGFWSPQQEELEQVWQDQGGLWHHSGRWGETEPQGLAGGSRAVDFEIWGLSQDPAISLKFPGACLAEYTTILTILTLIKVLLCA